MYRWSLSCLDRRKVLVHEHPDAAKTRVGRFDNDSWSVLVFE